MGRYNSRSDRQKKDQETEVVYKASRNLKDDFSNLENHLAFVPGVKANLMQHPSNRTVKDFMKLEKLLQHIVSRNEFLNKFSLDVQKKLLPYLHYKEFASNEYPYIQGDSGDAMYIIMTGKAKILIKSEEFETAFNKNMPGGDDMDRRIKPVGCSDTFKSTMLLGALESEPWTTAESFSLKGAGIGRVDAQPPRKLKFPPGAVAATIKDSSPYFVGVSRAPDLEDMGRAKHTLQRDQHRSQSPIYRLPPIKDRSSTFSEDPEPAGRWSDNREHMLQKIKRQNKRGGLEPVTIPGG
eukprot:CAMPEP_0118953662 /NCGR_PEP_ID=MMETSP1169-20130426/56959_1 /TAXON_ID=36882 /ORGANISM="Pyramimonas obovata, Strain CCMP722" /LENGTH=294 /DNA_ID=CAMNT_0006901179 /DNA_START=324 /DNA_END=1204 /DNA_ORIENTATION=+